MYLNCMKVSADGREILVAIRPTREWGLRFMRMLQAQLCRVGTDGDWKLIMVSDEDDTSWVWMIRTPDPFAGLPAWRPGPQRNLSGCK